MSYIVIVESKKTMYVDGNVATKDGDKYLVVTNEGNWVEATSREYNGYIPKDVKLFNTIEQAESFARRWGGHPWWCKPNGKYEVIEAKPIMRLELDYYVPV